MISIDLHCHSHYSDGAHSPEALIYQAKQAEIEMLALTDHDTVAGLPDLQKAVEKLASNITIINGIEWSVRWKKYEIHILGLNINLDSDHLLAKIEQQQDSRTQRALQIASCLQKIGIQDAYNKACAIANHQRIGRPHFAQLLIQEQRVADRQGAFKRYLGRGQLAYVETKWMSMEEAVSVIIEAGGCAVIAHPHAYKLTRTKLYALISDFRMAGGIGLEVVSGRMTAAQIQELAGICQRFDLLASSGSDFHSIDFSAVAIGQQQKLPLHCEPIWQQWTI